MLWHSKFGSLGHPWLATSQLTRNLCVYWVSSSGIHPSCFEALPAWRQGTLFPARGSCCVLPASLLIFILQESPGCPLLHDALPDCPTSMYSLQTASYCKNPCDIWKHRPHVQIPGRHCSFCIVTTLNFLSSPTPSHQPPTPVWDDCKLDNEKSLSLSVFIL